MVYNEWMRDIQQLPGFGKAIGAALAAGVTFRSMVSTHHMFDFPGAVRQIVSFYFSLMQSVHFPDCPLPPAILNDRTCSPNQAQIAVADSRPKR
jgi:hypothetical protein